MTEPTSPSKPKVKQGRLFDGLPIDDFAINFSGRIILEAGSELDMKLRDGLLIGHNIRVEVDCFVGRKIGEGKLNKEGSLETVAEAISLKVRSITVADWEDLGEA